MKSRLLSSFAALCLCFSGASITKPADKGPSTSDWPQWRGPQRNGISHENGLLKHWPMQGPKLLWQVNDIGDGAFTRRVMTHRLRYANALLAAALMSQFLVFHLPPAFARGDTG